MIERVEWTTKSGKQASVTVELVTSETLNADGHGVEVARCEIRTYGEVKGMGTIGYNIDRTVTEAARKALPDAAALCGNIVIPAAQLALIDAAIARMHATPEWQAHEAKVAKNRADAKEYEAHRAKMRGVMGY